MTTTSAHLLLGVLCLVGACAGSQLKPPPPSPPPPLEGAWQSGCLPIKNADDTDGSARVVYGVTPTLWALDTQLFGDDDCSLPTGTIHSDGGWQWERPSMTIPGAWEIRFDIRTRTMTPHVDGFISYLQSLNCGTDFDVGSSTDMLDIACPDLGLKPFAECQTEYDVVAGDGATLRIGGRALNRDRCDVRSRPPTLGLPLQRI